MRRRGTIAAAVSGVLLAGLVTTARPPIATAALPARVVQSMAAGGGHTLELHADGTVWAYGSNEEGELGRAENNNATPPTVLANPLPTQVAGLTDVTQVAAGGEHSVARRADGTVWTFGFNFFGQLGRADNVGGYGANPIPQQVAGITDAVAVAAGGSHTLVLRAGGTVVAFGANHYGQLGSSTNVGTDVPTPAVTTVAGLTGIVGIAASDTTSYAVKSDGTVWTFGSNFLGELGRPDDIGSSPHPVPGAVTGITTAVAASAGLQHGLVLLADGTVMSFGWNKYGQLGRAAGAGDGALAAPTPVAVPGVPAIRRIAAGVLHSVLLGVDGTVWTFGINQFGELGTTTDAGTTGFRFEPRQVLSGADDIAATSSTGGFGTSRHVLVRLLDGSLWGFGANAVGQLASVGPDIQSLPAPVGSVPPLSSAPGVFHSLPVTRVLDTRQPSDIALVKPDGEHPVTLTLDQVPADATAVVVNLTATEADGPGFVQVVPGGGKLGTTSTLNVERAGQIVANAAIVALGPDRTLTLYAQTPTHLVVDVAGYFEPTLTAVRAGRFAVATPQRLLDTRPGASIGYRGPKPEAGAITRVAVAGRAGAGSVDAMAAVVNVTVTEATAPGFVQVAPAGALVPGASSSLNVERAGQTVANEVIMPLSDDGALEIYTQSSMHVIVDIVGCFTGDTSGDLSTAGRFVAYAPARLLDTRPESITGYDGPKPLDDAQFPVVLPDEIVDGGVAAVAVNLTATEAAGPGFVQAAATGSLDPGATSSLNVERAGQTVANAAIVGTSGGRFDLYTKTSTHLVADVSGWFTAF